MKTKNFDGCSKDMDAAMKENILKNFRHHDMRKMILEKPHIYDKSTIAAIVYYYTVYIGGITQQEACSLCDITPRYYRELKARDEQALISFSDDMFMYDQNDVDSAMLTNACDAVYTALGIVTVGDEMYQMLKKHFAMKTFQILFPVCSIFS